MVKSHESFSGPTRVSVTEEEYKELAFLRYFYRAADSAFGPASSDIYHLIKKDYGFNRLPKSYQPEEDE